MASVIMFGAKNICSISHESTKEHWDKMTKSKDFLLGSPVIAKGNIIEGITAPW